MSASLVSESPTYVWIPEQLPIGKTASDRTLYEFTLDEVQIPEEFLSAMAAFEAGEVVDMETALFKEPPDDAQS
ncbi:MAG TPA: hypothetical protein VMN36_05910 [Verrucomicrobiales bacterium]|nr:hypothetical protein [Verrucomicrobiales bacterium]